MTSTSPSNEQATNDPPKVANRRRRAELRRRASDDKLLGKLAAKNTDFAKKLHDTAYIYALYGALDGLSLSYSTFKYLFDILCTNGASTSSDVMHDWMMTPAGIAAATAESLTIIAFSFLANIYDNKKNQKQFERYIATVWPYCRDTMKGLKNAYKGVRSMLLTAEMLGGQNLRTMIVPAGIDLGLISVVDRLCMRKFVIEPRKAMMKDNATLLASIQDIKFYDEFPGEDCKYNSGVDRFDESTCELFRKGYEYHLSTDSQLKEKNKLYFKLLEDGLEYSVVDPAGMTIIAQIDKKTLQDKGCKLQAPLNIEQLKPYMADILKITSERKHTYFTLGIQSQSKGLRNAALLGEAYRGVVDGLYLYMGAMSITALAPPVFITMAIFSVIFTVTCIATRLYEEWDYQRKLVETQAEIEMALCEKEIEAIFGRMQVLSEKQAGVRAVDPLDPLTYPLEADEYKEIQDASEALLETKLKEFESCKKNLRSQVLLSYTSAALAGLRNGLYAYSAISSLMFAIAMITAISSLSFPPFLVLAFGIAGMTCLIGFLAHSLITNYQHLKANPLEEIRPRDNINSILSEIKEGRYQVANLKPKEIESSILDDNFDQAPQFWFQEWFEVLRSFFSGVGKGQKSIDYTLNPLLELDGKGHYQDSPIMAWLSLATATIYTVVLTLRAHARGFGRPKITDTGDVTPAPSPSPVVETPAAVAPPSPGADNAAPCVALAALQAETLMLGSKPAGVLVKNIPAPSFSGGSLLNTERLPSAFTPIGRGADESEVAAPLLGVNDDSGEEGEDSPSPLRTLAANATRGARATRSMSGEGKALAHGTDGLMAHGFFNSTPHQPGIPRTASSSELPPPTRAAFGFMRATSAGQLPPALDRNISPLRGIVAGSM